MGWFCECGHYSEVSLGTLFLDPAHIHTNTCSLPFTIHLFNHVFIKQILLKLLRCNELHNGDEVLDIVELGSLHLGKGYWRANTGSCLC